MKPFWATFYSYKGGVGRSLSLANVAALLVQNGRRVVLIDFDLEAPGLDSFKEFNSIASKPGVVEYVAEFEKSKIAPPISDYTFTLATWKEICAANSGSCPPAGRIPLTIRPELTWIGFVCMIPAWVNHLSRELEGSSHRPPIQAGLCSD